MEAIDNLIDNDTMVWSVLWFRQSEDVARTTGVLLTPGLVTKWLVVSMWDQKRGHKLSGRKLKVDENGRGDSTSDAHRVEQ